jgi:hypothetical protein
MAVKQFHGLTKLINATFPSGVFKEANCREALVMKA